MIWTPRCGDCTATACCSLIVDLRGNPGGLLVSAVEVVNKFIDRGVVVSTRGRDARKTSPTPRGRGDLADPAGADHRSRSASAAEILAGAIRDHHRGTIVGVPSYGKGSVQGIFPLSYGNSGVRLTTALSTLPPDGRSSAWAWNRTSSSIKRRRPCPAHQSYQPKTRC